MAIEHLHAVPHLTTALRGPLARIETLMLENLHGIEQWLRAQWLETPPPFYASVDLRNAGFKLAPIDTNLFPAGFNKLNPAFQPLCIQALQAAVERFNPRACGIVIVPESHTRNLYYLENLATLARLIGDAGFDVRLGSLLPDLKEPLPIDLPSGRRITLTPLTREGDSLRVGDFAPCFVLLNNDLSGGEPAILKDVQQAIAPPTGLGWARRRKSKHFRHYREVATEFAARVGMDPWLIDPVFHQCGQVDFQKREGEECLVYHVDAVLTAVAAKYREYGIDEPPFAIIKSDAGTYGMNVLSVRSVDEVRELNRKQRTKMARGKEGALVAEVIVQEGVPTFESWEGHTAEPVVYMIDRYVVGGFYRVHAERGRDENLNAPGMTFEPLAFAECCISPDRDRGPDAHPNRFYTYGVIARLALVAAAREQHEVRQAASRVPA